MPDYQALDLTRQCNRRVDFFAAVGPPPATGRFTIWGLPVRIGGTHPPTDKAGKRVRPLGRCYIGFEGGEGMDAGVTVPLRKTARHVIFVHSLLESRLLEGEAPGRVVATYVVRYVDGSEERLPVRERYEVSALPPRGQGAFVAASDCKQGLMPRYEGRWSLAGRRQTEADGGLSQSYCLWPWMNRHPGRKIQSITVLPAGRKFLLAGITLSRLEEHPFSRQPARSVRIDVLRKGDACRPFDMTVQVDRGIAGYPYPLPSQSERESAWDGYAGWGESPSTTSVAAYVQVAGNASATLTVKSHGRTLARANWGKVQERGRVSTPRVRIELADPGRNWVHTTVVDEDTGRAIPCRVSFRSPDGIPYQPHGHHQHVNSDLGSWHMDVGGDVRLGQVTYAYIDGRCQGWLPRGEVVVDVARGFEYQPLRTRVRIEPGQRELTLRVKRVANMAERRWFSGDTHVHFLGAQGALYEAQGEDLRVVNLLQSQWGHLFTNSEDFVGRPVSSADGQTLVYCSQENRQHMLGHLSLLGLKRPVMPWCSDGPREAELGGSLETTLSRWADACRAQGGTVVIPHLPTPNGEPAALIATGRADAVEMISQGDYEHLEYYRYLNCGYRLPLVGGTDKMSNEVPVGLYRTYAYIPEDQEFSYDNWCAALRAGRTFLSGGPLLRFTVEGREIGDTLRLPAGGGTLHVQAHAQSILPMHSLEIVQEGRVVAASQARGGAGQLTVSAEIPVSGHTWLAARCGGLPGAPNRHHDEWRRGIFAHTSPVYVAVGGDWAMFDPRNAQYMLTLIHGSIEHIRQAARHDEPGAVTHHHHAPDHLAYLEEPFHQAIQALECRLREAREAH
ncbi:MAG: CehA/McbA family metallohydrolase [Phycisphaeraceae bacterium]|nr:CehA/McbA family metallohydrolase [Phycisphaeraceae bacterium]